MPTLKLSHSNKMFRFWSSGDSKVNAGTPLIIIIIMLIQQKLIQGMYYLVIILYIHTCHLTYLANVHT